MTIWKTKIFQDKMKSPEQIEAATTNPWKVLSLSLSMLICPRNSPGNKEFQLSAHFVNSFEDADKSTGIGEVSGMMLRVELT